MVFSAKLCHDAGAHNVYFTITAKDLDQFSFPPSTQASLMEREFDNLITFMAYD